MADERVPILITAEAEARKWRLSGETFKAASGRLYYLTFNRMGLAYDRKEQRYFTKDFRQSAVMT